MQPDNWGRSARFGVFIVGAEPVPEAEWWAMAPPGVSIHAARVTASTPWAAWNADRSDVDLSDDLIRGARQLAGLAPDVVVLGHSSSSVLGGSGWDAAVAAKLTDLMGGGGHVTTNGDDCLAAMAALGATKPFVVIPPWFGEAFIEKAGVYLADRGLSPVSLFRHIPEDRWRDTPPGELYVNHMHLHQNIDLLFDQVVTHCPDDADSVLMIGTGLRCVAMIDGLERALDRPVVTANQASLWRCLSLAGLDAQITGYGRLFDISGAD